jgi:HEAT repeat protein
MLLSTLINEHADNDALLHLADLLRNDRDPNVRKHLARIFSNRMGENTEKALLGSLATETDDGVLIEAIKGAAFSKSVKTLPSLLSLIKEGSPAVKREAALAIASYNSHESLGYLLSLLANEGDKETTAAAQAALSILSPHMVLDRLRRDAGSEDVATRMTALSAICRAIRSNRIPEYEEILNQALSDPESRVRREALRGLSETSSLNAVEVFHQLLLSDPDPLTRIEAAKALVTQSGAEMGEVAWKLSEALRKEPDAAVRSAIAGLYGSFDRTDKKVCDTLRELCYADRDESVRLMASQTLYNYSGRLSSETASAYQADAVKIVMDILRSSGSSSVKSSAITVLGAIGNETEIAFLQTLAGDSSEEEVKQRAIRAIEQIKGKGSKKDGR